MPDAGLSVTVPADLECNADASVASRQQPQRFDPEASEDGHPTLKRSIGTSANALRPPTAAASIHLDALRGLAAWCVLLSHWRDCLFVDYAESHLHTAPLTVVYLFTGLGHEWVVVFFVLSGYLVGGSVLRQIDAGRWSWGEYALNRFTRLYTVLIPALVLGGLIDLAGIHLFGTRGIYGGHTGAHELGSDIATRLSLSIAAANYAFLQDIYVPVLGTNGPLWSLSYEFWYYLAFPLLMLALSARRSPASRVLNTCLLAVLMGVIGRDVAMLGLVWLMGVAIHWLPVDRFSHPLRRRLWKAGSLLATIATLAACKLVHGRAAGFRHFVPSDLVLGVIVSLFVCSVLASSGSRLPAAYTWIAQHTAKSSYTLYLVHVPAIVFLTAWLSQPRWQPEARHMLLGLAILTAVFVYAQIVYYCFERNTASLRVWIKAGLQGAWTSRRRQVEERPPITAVTSLAQKS